MSIVRLGELQRVYRARQKSRHRVDLRKYLRDHAEPSAAAYQTVSRRLCAKGAIDNLELADAWVGTASLPERAALFSDIATALSLRWAGSCSSRIGVRSRPRSCRRNPVPVSAFGWATGLLPSIMTTTTQRLLSPKRSTRHRFARLGSAVGRL
jgi:hypothetical protein